jgi:murein DD-endopeptidase MepM/ murein hydrolase activator NlpD
MIKTSTTTMLLLLSYSLAFAQQLSAGSGVFSIEGNDANNPCLTREQYLLIEKQCAENIKNYDISTAASNKTMSTAFNWPLKTIAGFKDPGYYFVAAYVDQNSASGAAAISDWDCGTTTYDGHRGTDIGIYPYSFYKMDNDMVEVIAAAAGTIITKVDGNFDKNCNTTASGATPNHIIIQHADGSRALYLHMKKGSLTTKNVGDAIAQGEFIGRVGSSGSSSGPHLHFEVWSGSTSTTLVDPFYGTCNKLNASSWWAAQKNYTEPAILNASVHPVVAVLPACPGTETPNEAYCYTAAQNAQAQFYVFMRNETPNLIMNLRIVNPDGSTFGNPWTRTNGNVQNYPGTYTWYTKYLPTLPGIYQFETIYNGVTHSQPFEMNCSATGIANLNEMQQIAIYPNPASNSFNLSANHLENGSYRFSLKSLIGQTVFDETNKVENNQIQRRISIAEYPNGIYFLNIENGSTNTIRKVIVQN